MANDGIRRITADDICSFRLISEPRFSPDGRAIAYVVTTIEREKNDYRSSIYVAATDGSSTRRITRADAKDSLPRWSPDGKQIAFVSTRSEKPQVWMIRADGGEAWQVSSLHEGASAFAWSPDGANVVVVSKSDEHAPENAPKDEKDKDETTSDVRHIKKARYRTDDDGFLDFKPKHLWVVPIGGGSAHQLTSADADDLAPAWSPNGHDIAFVTNRTDGRDLNTASEVWAVASVGGGERRLLGGEKANFANPAWSPDGATLAVIGNWHAGDQGPYDRHVWIVPAGGGEARCLTEGFGRSIEDSTNSDVFSGSDARPEWTPDGKGLLVLVADTGATNAHVVDVASGEIRRITGGKRRVSAVSLSPDGKRIAFVAATATSPGDLFVCDMNGRNERQLTTLNADFLGSVALTEPEEFRVPSKSDGVEIHGWVLKPPGFDPARKYPLILQIHGGPLTQYGDAFMHEFHLMAARGYVVVYCNPRGSSGYGEPFARHTHKAWGETDMPDIMATVDWVIGQGYIDETRLGITGGSYGGYMTNWIIGHTDRFRAAVTQRCVSNLHSFYGTSDIGWFFIESQFGGNPWDDREHLMKYSPISYVADITTPLLILHSEQDYRCPIEQAEQMFISLKRLGREVELVRVPDSNHNLSRSGKPKLRIERLEHIVSWFDRHL